MPKIDNAIYFNSKDYEEYRFLSNFWFSPFDRGDGLIIYKTVEHFYQSQKTINLKSRMDVINSRTPREAKRLGRAINLRENWQASKDKVMLVGLLYKFETHRDLLQELVNTGDKQLIEWAPWGDTYWGVDKNYEGQNKLGRMLMLIRDKAKG